MKTSTRHTSNESGHKAKPHLLSAEAHMPHVSTIQWDAQAEGERAMLAEQMVECAPVAMVALDTNMLCVTIANERARMLYAEALGPGAPELVGAHVDRYLPLLQRYGIWNHLRAAIETGQTRRGIQVDGIAMKGREQPSSWILDIVPLKSVGEVSTLLITVIDHTAERLERERGEHAVYTAELRAERMEAILDQAGDAVLICDAEGQTVAYNRAALAFATNHLEVEQARARGRRIEPIWALLRPDHTPLPEIERPATRAMLTGMPIATVELALRRDDGAETPLIVQATPLRDEAETVTGAIVTFHDITTMKEIERQKDELIAVASHELRQPLTVIQGQAQMIRRHLRHITPGGNDERFEQSAEALKRISEGIESQTLRLNTLVSDLLDMSRIQTGQLRLDPVRLPLLPIIHHVVGLQRQSTESHTFTLAERLPIGMPAPQGMWDPRRIEQILVNLLGNAVKYSPHGGEIGVEVGILGAGRAARRARSSARDGGQPTAHLVVRDAGIGIPEEALPHLFEQFFRAGNAVGIQGTGLGLYISRQLARAHGGDLWAESKGIGQGSAFHLTLLLLPPPPPSK